MKFQTVFIIKSYLQLLFTKSDEHFTIVYLYVLHVTYVCLRQI